MLEPVEEQYIVIGHVVRSHGVKGEVVVQPAIESPGLFDDLQLVRYRNHRQELVPARIERVRSQQKGNRLSFFVKFEHVSDRNRAEELKGVSLYVRRDKIAFVEEEKPDSFRFLDWEVFDEDGSPVGTVTGIMESPAHPILEVTGEGERQWLIPFVDEYVRSVEEETGRILCRRLEQLAGL